MAENTLLGLGMLGTMLASIVTFLTLMFNAKEQRLREERLRKWEVEDRQALAQKVAEASAALARTVSATGEQLASRVKAQHQSVLSAIAENTEKTEQATEKASEAYREANHVNNKISALQEQLVNISSSKKGAGS